MKRANFINNLIKRPRRDHPDWEPYIATALIRPSYISLEKALLDYFYFLNGPVTREVVEELRLQNLETLNEERLLDFTAKFHKPKIARAAEEILAYRKELLAGDRAALTSKTFAR